MPSFTITFKKLPYLKFTRWDLVDKDAKLGDGFSLSSNRKPYKLKNFPTLYQQDEEKVITPIQM